MPNIRSQTVHNDGGQSALTIVASDGRSITLNKAQIQTFYQGTVGNTASRRAQGIVLVKNAILAALGPEQISLADIALDFDIATGRLTDLLLGR